MERKIIQEAFRILNDRMYYDQTQVVNKLRTLGKDVSRSTFSNIIRSKTVKKDTLAKVSEGILELMHAELGYQWKENTGFIEDSPSGWESIIIPELKPDAPSIIQKPGYAFHEQGRLSIQEKVNFLFDAQKEVIEFGITLNTFTSYFFNRADWEFKSYVETLLSRGINFKCYFLDPNSNEARLYFEDRKRCLPEESNGTEVIKEIIHKLGMIQKMFSLEGYPGKFQIFTYKHIPYNHFMIVDGDTINGKMMVSHYIYGISRANCPVIAFTKNDNHSLYRKYWLSYQSLIKDAREISAD